MLCVTYISDVQVGFRLGNGAGHTIVGTANQTLGKNLPLSTPTPTPTHTHPPTQPPYHLNPDVKEKSCAMQTRIIQERPAISIKQQIVNLRRDVSISILRENTLALGFFQSTRQEFGNPSIV